MSRRPTPRRRRRIDELVAQLRKPMPVLPLRWRAGRNEHRGAPPGKHRSARTTGKMVETAREYIAAGDIFQVVLSQRVDVPTPAHPFTIYRALRTINPRRTCSISTSAITDRRRVAGDCWCGSRTAVVTNHPIAGTRPRGADAEAGRRAGERAAGRREGARRAHHAGRSRAQRCRPRLEAGHRARAAADGDRALLARHAHRQQCRGRDQRRLQPARRAAGLLPGRDRLRRAEDPRDGDHRRAGGRPARRLLPARSATSSFSGRMDTCIALRTLVLKDGVASMQAGGGIVADSTPDGEYAESFHKMRALAAGDRAAPRRSSERCGEERDDSADRQLRLVHLQPLPVPRASLARRSRRPQRQDHGR